MSEILMATSPTFNDLADADIGAEKALTDDAIGKISNNAKFAGVRCEIFDLGHYQNGDTVQTPVSPVDGYAYALGEIIFDFQLYSTRAVGTPFFGGQGTPPAIAASQAGNLLWLIVNIEDATGVVSLQMSYTNDAGVTETTNNDGMVRVLAFCQRSGITLGAIPEFVDVPEDILAVAQPLREGNDDPTQDGIIDISHNAKFAAVRCEIIYQGFWRSNGVVTLPVSPIDGYTYKRGEVHYKAILYSTLHPSAFTQGTTTPPTVGAATLVKRMSVGALYWYKFDVDDVTGTLNCGVSYFVPGGAESIYDGSAPLNSIDGVLKIYAICQRESVNAAIVGSGFGLGGPGGTHV